MLQPEHSGLLADLEPLRIPPHILRVGVVNYVVSFEQPEDKIFRRKQGAGKLIAIALQHVLANEGVRDTTLSAKDVSKLMDERKEPARAALLFGVYEDERVVLLSKAKSATILVRE